MEHQDNVYLAELEYAMTHGVFTPDRTGVGSYSVFGRLARYNLWQNRLPILTTKKMFCDSFIHEMLWFISGDTNIRYLVANGVNIWNSWLIPGTEEYGNASAEDYEKALRKHFNVKKLHYRFEGAALGDNDYQLLSNDDGSSTLVLSTRGFPRGTTHFVKTVSFYKTAYKHVFGDAPLTKLIAGDIGVGGYGSQWRHWEDTRLVSALDAAKYVERGYEYVTEVNQGESETHGGKVVLTREVDQLADAIHLLSTKPDSRRIIVNAWNPGKTEDAALPPCHMLFQFFSTPLTLKEMMELGTDAPLPGYGKLVAQHMFNATQDMPLDFTPERVNDDEQDPTCFKPGFTEALRNLRAAHGFPVRSLSTMLVMRSNDLPIGHPFNVAQYGLLTHMVAQVTNHVGKELVWVGGNNHIYADQMELAEEQLGNLPYVDVQPRVKLNPEIVDIDSFKFTDIKIEGYDRHHPHIPYPVAV